MNFVLDADRVVALACVQQRSGACRGAEWLAV